MILTTSNFKFTASRLYLLLILISIILQFFLWLNSKNIKPNLTIIPNLPNKYTIKALAFGDEEFYFRTSALRIQNAGDSFGNFTALKDYDYHKLYKWFKILDSLNSQSQLIPSLASYYYSQTQNKSDTIYLIKYLDEFASRDIDKYWWWMFQAFFIAEFSLKNNQLAIEMANKLSSNNNFHAPIWTKQLPAFLYARNNQSCTAFSIIEKILSDHESGIRKLDKQELSFMNYFIKNKLKSLEEEKFNPLKCK